MRRWLYILLLTVVASCSMSGLARAQIDTKNVITIGVNAIFFKDYVLAIQYFNTAIRNSPDLADPYYYRGLAKFSLDDYQGAELDADAAISRNPFIYDAYYLRAISRHSIGRDSLAVEDYKIVLTNNPDHQGALHNSAVLYVALNDTTSARQQLDRLRRFFPKYAPGYVIDGRLHLQQGDTIGAQTLFQKALETTPNLTGAYLSLAGIAYDQEHFGDALRYIDEALKYDDGSSELYTNRAIIRYRLNDLRGAMADYTSAIDMDGTNEIALYNRALLRSRVGDLNNALDDLNQVLLSDPENYFAILNRAIISNQIGNYRTAEHDLDKIIARYPSFAGAYSERARALQAQGKTTAAKRDLYYLSKLMFDSQTARKAVHQQQQINQEIESEEAGEGNMVRDEKDKNIRKFRMLVFNSRAHNYDDLYVEDKGIRGRIQDRESSVLPEHMYTLSYYDVDPHQLSTGSNTKYASQLGLVSGTAQSILVLRDLPQLNQVQLQQHMMELDSLKSADVHTMQRAMDELTLKDYEANIRTLTAIIDLDPDNAAAYFQRAVSRVMAYSARAELKHNEQKRKETTAGSTPTVPQGGMDEEVLLRKAMAQEAIWDLQRVTELVPDFAPAYYNVGYIQYLVGQYPEAIEAYTIALDKDGSMGEALFNRGLAHYSMGEKAQGDADLSAAGALGIYRSYSIIKRMK